MKKKPTDAELEILQILWQNGPSSVRFVNSELNKNREVVYTTTLKMMQMMVLPPKGFLKRDTSQRTHLYEAILQQEEVQENVVNKLVNTLFQGSPIKLAIQALGHEKTSTKDLEALKHLIENLEKDNS